MSLGRTSSPQSCAAVSKTPPERTEAAPTNQNSGPLSLFMEELKEHLPSDYGLKTVGQVLQHLKDKSPSTFEKLDQIKDHLNSSFTLSDTTADAWKAKGNDAFKECRYERAIQDYTSGIHCAASTEILSTLLNNRSTVFYKLKRYADACLDAHRCLITHPNYWKALHRRGSALQQLGFAQEGERDIKAAEREDVSLSNRVDQIAPIIGSLLKGMAQCSIPPIAQVGSSVKILCVQERRSIVAAEKIEPGTEVLKETPCACIAGWDNLLSTCSFCLQHTNCLYPGEPYRAAGKKSRGLFCSDDCATSAWQYYGSSETENLFFICCPDDALLAYRLLQGKQKFLIEDTRRSNCNSSESEELLNDKDNLLCNFSKELDPQVRVGGYETLASALGLYMNAYTPDMAELARKAHRQVLLYAIEVKCQLRQRLSMGVGENENPCEMFSKATVNAGKGMYATAILLKHSCHPNCFLSFKENPLGCCAELAVRAIRPVMPDEELTIAYGGITRFHFHSKAHRLQLLRRRYGFVCHCDACQSDIDSVVSSGEKENYVKAADYYQKGCRLIREKNYTTAVTVLLQSYEIVMRYICPPPRPPLPMLPLTHRSLALAYFHLNNRPKCQEHLEAALHLDIQLHKDENRLELIDDYTRLSSVATDVEKKKMYTWKAIDLLERFYTPSTTLSIVVEMIKTGLPTHCLAPKIEIT